MAATLTTEQKTEALTEVARVIEIEIEHVTELLKFEPEDAKKKGRYESGGGDPLPTDLAQRFNVKLVNLKLGYAMIQAAIRKVGEAQVASGSAEREPV